MTQRGILMMLVGTHVVILFGSGSYTNVDAHVYPAPELVMMMSPSCRGCPS